MNYLPGNLLTLNNSLHSLSAKERFFRVGNFAILRLDCADFIKNLGLLKIYLFTLGFFPIFDPMRAYDS